LKKDLRILIMIDSWFWGSKPRPNQNTFWWSSEFNKFRKEIKRWNPVDFAITCNGYSLQVIIIVDEPTVFDKLGMAYLLHLVNNL